LVEVTVMKAVKWLWPLALGLLAHGAHADVDEISFLRCRPIADPGARLACYDALKLQPPSTAGAVRAAGAGAPALPGETVPVPAIALFGMEHQNDQQVKEINTRLIGIFEGWGPRTKFRLENGQVWQVSDDSNAVYSLKSPKVKISRAVLSGFEMEIEGAKRAPRVKRLE
jgi:hypothetical protein